MNLILKKLSLIAITSVSLLTLSTTTTFALPIDWNGSLGFDSTMIKNVRRSSDNCTATNGSECIGNDNSHARFQTMLLKLNPTLIVNDSTSIKGELSTGSMRGGYLAEDSVMAESGSYFSQTASGNSLNVNQIYAELYADTALFKVGKFSKHYGLGVLINDGKNSWDRFFSVYSGIQAYFKLGNFKLIPVWAKVDSNNSNDTTANPTGKYDAFETAITAMYDNSNNNLKVGVYYGIREVETNNELYGTNSGPHSVNIIDIFFEKIMGDFSIAMEIPMLSGDLGNSYGGTDQYFDTNAYVLESSYQINPKWKLGVNAGMIKGSDGDANGHEAMYLHPNYQVAQIMFRYNLQGFQNGDQNVFNSSIVNTNYTKFFAHYNNAAWSWKLDFIMAKANETASNGSTFFDHNSKSYISANADQDDDLGYEFDISFDYEWNPSIIVTGFLGYYQVGDFYAFTNGSEDISVSDVTSTGFKLSINF